MIAGWGGKGEGGNAGDDGKIPFLAFSACFLSPPPRPSWSRSLCKAARLAGTLYLFTSIFETIYSTVSALLRQSLNNRKRVGILKHSIEKFSTIFITINNGFLSFNQQQQNLSTNSLFIEHMEQNGYLTFKPLDFPFHVNNTGYLAIKDNGKFRRMERSKPGMHASQFAFLPSLT